MRRIIKLSFLYIFIFLFFYLLSAIKVYAAEEIKLPDEITENQDFQVHFSGLDLNNTCYGYAVYSITKSVYLHPVKPILSKCDNWGNLYNSFRVTSNDADSLIEGLPAGSYSLGLYRQICGKTCILPNKAYLSFKINPSSNSSSTSTPALSSAPKYGTCEKRKKCSLESYPTCEKNVISCDSPNCSEIRSEAENGVLVIKIDCAHPAEGSTVDTPPPTPDKTLILNCPICPTDYPVYDRGNKTCTKKDDPKQTKAPTTKDCSYANTCIAGCGCDEKDCPTLIDPTCKTNLSTSNLPACQGGNDKLIKPDRCGLSNFGYKCPNVYIETLCKNGSNIVCEIPPPPPLPCKEGLMADGRTHTESKDLIVQCLTYESGIGIIGTNALGFIETLFSFILGIIGGIALIMLIYAGYLLLISRGDKEKLQQARERITSTIIGLLFIVFSIAILEIIGVDILKIPGLSH